MLNWRWSAGSLKLVRESGTMGSFSVCLSYMPRTPLVRMLRDLMSTRSAGSIARQAQRVVMNIAL